MMYKVEDHLLKHLWNCIMFRCIFIEIQNSFNLKIHWD